jgi:hypothetical protein
LKNCIPGVCFQKLSAGLSDLKQLAVVQCDHKLLWHKNISCNDPQKGIKKRTQTGAHGRGCRLLACITTF